MDILMGVCEACYQPAFQRCAGCRAVSYCSRDCQKKHWKAHKDICRPYTVEVSKEVGRCLTSSRDLETGEIILKESPLVLAPAKFSKPMCLGCHHRSEKLYNCNACGWPVCSEVCEKSKQHRPECTLTQQGRNGEKIVFRDMGRENPAMAAPAILRCLYLKDKDTKKWNTLLQLQDHAAERRRLGHEEIDRGTICRYVVDYLRLKDTFPEDLVLKIIGIIHVNGFEVPVEGGTLTAIYPTACFIENDCAPNATRHVTKTGDIVLRATLDILKGDHIAICYSDPLWGTMNRQNHLKESKYFTCRCTRCRDPTESGTYMSSVKCKKCGGFVQPQDPLDEECSWICSKCDLQVDPSGIIDVIEKIGKELVETGKGGVKELEAFIEKYKKVLHPHHFYMCDAKLALVQIYGHESEKGLFDLSEEQIDRKEQLCLELLRIVDAVSPGKSRLRGILLYELQALVALRSRQACIEESISKDELTKNVKAVRSMLEESSTIFGWEAEDVGEGQLAFVASKELADVEEFLKSLTE